MGVRGRVGLAGCLLAVAACSSTGTTAAGPPTPTRSAGPSASASPTPSPTPAPPVLASLGTFSGPVWVGPAPGDDQHLYLVERTGRVFELDPQGRREHVVLDLRSQVSTGAEQGLLSLAFDPSYRRNRRLYVDYTDKAGDTQVAAYTVANGVATQPQPLLTVKQPYPNHNGGLVLFDRTGMLLVGMGDGGNAGDPQNRAQDLNSDLGKILRVDPRTGAGAPGNPYPSNPLVWALGLRNPWRFAFDAAGYLYLGDVGQSREEELDVVAPAQQRGANYGWSVFEGDRPFKAHEPLTTGGPLIAPALTYSHADGSCSITAGSVYLGHALPYLRGAFVYGDYCSGHLLAVRRHGNRLGVPVDLGVKAEGLQAFGVDLQGELLVMTPDTLFRLVPRA